MMPDQQQTTDVNKNVTLTVRNIPSDVNARITMQARSAGKSKSDFLNAFLTLSFGDLLGHFIRTSELVTLMDKEIARFAGRELTAQWFESELTPAYHRIYCRLLNLENEEDIKKMMMSNIPYLEQRTHQIRYSHMPFLPRGSHSRWRCSVRLPDGTGKPLPGFMMNCGLWWIRNSSTGNQ
ncbi:hypothetical protein [Escherichia coli]|uniref:hypothetical protein n=1 Tax=Escherichia coli TaxID=562 RepID=UPI001EE1ACA9|nr:hypothetical protein [Escherichia coli]GJH75870.1 hypothetical protein ECZC06_54640 [Escherichia coli]